MNAQHDLRIPTPDGSGQAVHPDVLHVPSGFLGYEYWMGCTPYPFGADRLENPIIRVSHDGMNWLPFPGAPDPLIEAPADEAWHHADTDIVLHGGTLYVFYISTNREVAATTFSFVSSVDGIHWSMPTEIYRDSWGVSPAFVVDESGTWSMWYVIRDALARSQESTVYRRSGPSVTSLGTSALCKLQVPGHVVWHLDVIQTGNAFEALVTAFPYGTDPSRCRLFHAVSDDGCTFRLTSDSTVIRPTWLGWDNRMIYRSSFLKSVDGSYRIWYSAASWGMRCGIGIVEGSIDRLLPVATESRSEAPPALRRLLEDAVGLFKYSVYWALPAPAYALVLFVWARVRRPSPTRQ